MCNWTRRKGFRNSDRFRYFGWIKKFLNCVMSKNPSFFFFMIVENAFIFTSVFFYKWKQFICPLTIKFYFNILENLFFFTKSERDKEKYEGPSALTATFGDKVYHRQRIGDEQWCFMLGLIIAYLLYEILIACWELHV